MKQWLKERLAGVGVERADPGHARVSVLCFHSVGPAARVSRDRFRAQLEWLGEHCRVIRFADAVETARHPGSTGGRAAVAITFDDGYRDNYEHAFPLLAAYGLPATFFLTVGLVERDPGVVARIRSLRGSSSRIEPLDWSQIAEMHAAGAEFGAHTYSHANLIRLRPDALDSELRRPKAVLEGRLGEPVTMLAYPFGKPNRHFSASTLDAVRDAGYEIGATTVNRGLRAADAPLALPRLLVGDDDAETLRAKACGAWDFLGRWQERAPVWAARLVSPDDFAV